MSPENSCCLGPLEREVLKIVWEEECPTVRCVLLSLNKHRSTPDKLAYTTVMTILKRLVKKEILLRKKDGRSFVYQSKETKAEFINRVTQCTLNSLIDKFGELGKQALKTEISNL